MNTAVNYCYNIYRRCVTGANEYGYYQKEERIGSATALTAYHYPVIINGNGRTLYCEQDPGMTLFPGCRKTIFSGDREYAKVVYLGRGQHCLEIGSHSIRAITDRNAVSFYHNDILVAALRANPGRSGVSGDWEHRQTLSVLRELHSDVLLLLLSFPLLQIGI